MQVQLLETCSSGPVTVFDREDRQFATVQELPPMVLQDLAPQAVLSVHPWDAKCAEQCKTAW